MGKKLAIVDVQKLLPQEITDIDNQVLAFIERHKNNRAEINRLFFDGMMALTAGEQFAQNMNSQGRLKRFWKRFTGGNNRNQDEINVNLVNAQYAAQQTLQKFFEQQLISFELIAVVNNRLNAQMISVNDEIIGIKNTLVNFFSGVKQKLEDHEDRIKRLEHSDELQHWSFNINVSKFDGVRYRDLDDITKLVCIIRDFWNITDANISSADFEYLETTLYNVGLDPDAKICYETFIRRLSTDEKLRKHLLGESYQFATEDEPIVFTLNKINRLYTEEKYIVQTTERALAKNGINVSAEEIVYQLAEDFVNQEADFNLSAETCIYEVILELLYNLAQFKYAKEQLELAIAPKNLTVKELVTGDLTVQEILPIVLEMAEAGDVQARYMVAVMYSYASISSTNYEREMLAQNIVTGDICSIFRGSGGYYHLVDASELKKYTEKLRALADSGDIFAQYELAYHEDDKSPLKERYFKMAADQNYIFAQYQLAFVYRLARGVERDYKKALELFKQVHSRGYYQESSIADCYEELNQHDEQLIWLQKGYRRSEKDFAGDLGKFYYSSGGDHYKNYSKAIQYYKRAIGLGKAWNGFTEYRIAEMYLEGGYGITAGRSTAREWMKKAAEKGWDNAKKWLRENPY